MSRGRTKKKGSSVGRNRVNDFDSQCHIDDGCTLVVAIFKFKLHRKTCGCAV